MTCCNYPTFRQLWTVFGAIWTRSVAAIGQACSICYDLKALPRTNNDLEGLFRDTKRRLLRTSGQKGQTQRALQRTGAWELLPRPSTEAACRDALSQVSASQLDEERHRFQRHQERFRLHTRSAKRIQTQFDKLREQWLSLAATSTG